MATSARHLCRSLFQVSRQIPVKRKCQPQFVLRHREIVPLRQISTTSSLKADEPTNSRSAQEASQSQDDGDGFDGPAEYLTPGTLITANDLSPEERADYDLLSKRDQREYLALQNHYAAVFESAQADAALDDIVTDVDKQVDKEVENVDFPDSAVDPREIGYWALDEDDEFGQVEDGDEPWDDSAISSVAHSELEVHREVREYTRVIAWDMPLLQQYAKPFQPPTNATPLRFRYTTYMGEAHPAAKKVVVQFCTKDMPNLTEAQRLKLIKLVGPRYNPDTDMVKMSSEKFEAPAQNKRYLGDLVNKLLDEARNGADSFEDIPLDFRHHKSKKQVTFPEEWKLKPGRIQELLRARQNQALLGAGETPASASKEAVHSYVQTLNRGGISPQRTL
ncbi:Small ribosomal subunit protein mS35 [Exophiala dermatitidis]